MNSVIISVVIPVYKSKNCLQELYDRLKVNLELITPEFEILLVEDCGEDGSWEVIEQLAKKDLRVRGMQFSRNFGQHYGITAGLDNCVGKWAVIMDCDLQDRPEEIPRLYAKAQEGFDMVIALRGKRQDPASKRFFSYLFYRIFSYLSDLKHDGDSGNFRIISRRVINNFCQMREQLRFFGGLMQWMGFQSTSIRVQHSARLHGVSTYTFSKLLKLSLDTIIAYSDKPLRISIKLGFFMALTSFLIGINLAWHAIINGVEVQGWTSLILAILFIGGIIIIILGIIGIYLGKVFDEVKGRPLYIIRRTTDSDEIIAKRT
jgi:glycosyltransferase involved in cell wall biosynthesis